MSTPRHSHHGIGICIQAGSTLYDFDCDANYVVCETTEELTPATQRVVDRSVVVYCCEITNQFIPDAAHFLMGWLCELMILPAQRRSVLVVIALMVFLPFDVQWIAHLVGPRDGGKSTLVAFIKAAIGQ